MIDLGTLGGHDASSPWGINAAGQVTGRAAAANGRQHPFVWDGRQMIDLGTLSGVEGVGLAINDLGHVTGDFGPAADGHFHAFIWDGSTMRDLNAAVDPSDPLKSFMHISMGLDINKRGQIAANGFDTRTSTSRALLVTPLEYKVVFVGPAANSQWKQGTTVPVKVALVSRDGKRISDSRAASLVGVPCKMKFSATGAQPRSAVCMKYDATANVFYRDWKLDAVGTGSAKPKVAATYKFSMPEVITTTRSRTISIVH